MNIFIVLIEFQFCYPIWLKEIYIIIYYNEYKNGDK